MSKVFPEELLNATLTIRPCTLLDYPSIVEQTLEMLEGADLYEFEGEAIPKDQPMSIELEIDVVDVDEEPIVEYLYDEYNASVPEVTTGIVHGQMVAYSNERPLVSFRALGERVEEFHPVKIEHTDGDLLLGTYRYVDVDLTLTQEVIVMYTSDVSAEPEYIRRITAVYRRVD